MQMGERMSDRKSSASTPGVARAKGDSLWCCGYEEERGFLTSWEGSVFRDILSAPRLSVSRFGMLLLVPLEMMRPQRADQCLRAKCLRSPDCMNGSILRAAAAACGQLEISVCFCVAEFMR